MYNAILVDDESKSRLTLAMLLKKYCPSVEIVGEAASVEEAVPMIKSKDPDLLFLDIQLNDGTGFDILMSLGDIRSKIIFTTAYDQYAIKAFKFSAIDYLLKPIDPDQLVDLCGRLEKINFTEPNTQRIQALTENTAKPKRIALQSMQGVFYVEIENIIRCEADSNYTIFHIKDRSKMVVAKSLKEYEELLSDMNFFRAHKSHLINMSYVKKYDSKTGVLILHDDFEVEVARRRKDALAQLFLKA